MTEDARYPIGRFQPDPERSAAKRAGWIVDIRNLPERMRDAVRGLDDPQLDTPYREGGWTVRQLVHHVPDSHLNAYTRFRLGLTEEAPTIRPYDEGRWAELPDARTAPLDVSLGLLEALHRRWVLLLDAMGDEEFARTIHHPEQGRTLTLDLLLQLYAWHGRHHVAHIEALRDRRGW